MTTQNPTSTVISRRLLDHRLPVLIINYHNKMLINSNETNDKIRIEIVSNTDHLYISIGVYEPIDISKGFLNKIE